MISTRFLTTAIATASLAGSVLAASVLGTWKGKIQMQMPPLPANATPQQRQQAQMVRTMMAKMVIVLTLKANKTYTVEMKGGPQSAPKPEGGAWIQKGNRVILKSPKPKPGGRPEPDQELIVSKDGKTMTMTPAGAPGKVRFVFTR